MTRLSLCLLFLLTIQTAGWSQQTAKDDYSTQSFVSEQSETSIEFQNDGNFVRRDHEKILIQAEAGRQSWGLLRFPYESEHDELKIDFLRVIKPNGTVVENEVSSAQDLPSAMTQQAPMYSDTREKHLPVKGLNIGDRIEFAYTTRSKTPMIPGQFWFSYSFADKVISLNETLRVSVPAGRNVKLRSVVSQPRVEKSGDRVIYAWKHENTRVPDNDEGPDPDEVLDRAQVGDIQLTSFATWEEIGRWYWQLQGDRARSTPEVAAKAKEITQGKTNPEAKARALAHFVATQIRYIATEFGMGRYQAHSAAEVLASGYGDCKDKHTLYAAMLESIGLQAYPVLIGTGWVIDPSTPTVADFNHVFTVVKLPAKDIWVDTTGEIYPFGFLPMPLRDKDVLMASAEPQLLHTPAEPNRPGVEKFTITAALGADGLLEGDVKREVTGDLEVPLRTAFRAVPEASWKDLVQKWSQLSGFGGTVENVKVTPPDDTDSTLTIEYAYKRKDYAGFSTGYTNPPLPPSGVAFVRLEKRKKDFVLYPVGRFEYSAQMRLPAGARMEAPDDVDLVDEFAEYHAKYRVEGNIFFAARVTIIKKQKVTPAQFASYEKFAKAVSDDVTKQSYLSLGSNVATGTPKLVSRPPSAELANLVNRARDAYMRADFRTALALTQKVLDQDPDYPNGWTIKASVHLALGEETQAIAALKKDIELHPSGADDSYKMLDQYYRRTDRMPQAMELTKKYAETHPGNLTAKLALARVYMAQKEHAKADEIYQKALLEIPEDPQIMLESATAKLELGKADEAFEAMQKVIKADPTKRNSAAYLLIDKNVHVEQALAWSEAQVKELEELSSKMSLDMVSVEDARLTANLAANWDTLGWAHYRAGRFAEAERYLRAAYTVIGGAEVGEHYAEALEKVGKNAAALDLYAIAANGRGEAAKKAQSRLAALVPPKANSMIAGARSRSSTDRTFKIPGAKAGAASNSADVLLLFGGNGKVEQLKFLSASHPPNAEQQLRAIDFGLVFPSSNPAKILRRGIFFCGTYVGCTVTLMEPETVRSVN